MRSSLIINILLLSVVAALTALLLVAPAGSPEGTIIRLTDVLPDRISRIGIEHGGHDPVTFTKQENGWLMTSPYRVQANEARINAILRLLTAQSFSLIDASQVELSRFGLDTPQLRVQLDDHVFLFGNTEALDERRYVLTANTIYLINDTLYPQLTTSATFFVSPRLLPGNAEVISLQLPGYSLQQVDNKWTAQPAIDIDNTALPELVRSWQQVSAITVSPYEPDQDSGEIRIYLQDGEDIRFRIVSMPPGLILARPDIGIQYHLDSAAANRLHISGHATQEGPEHTGDNLSN